ncbi:glutamate receptor 2.1-like [Rutidosis leptorrhynchoides]|uniref:glutamate receptor 2.1-like n=1 Tax=Rutidosis leptorrhynchoides TaxID=125765 RepID=UPI003A99E44D
MTGMVRSFVTGSCKRGASSWHRKGEKHPQRHCGAMFSGVATYKLGGSIDPTQKKKGDSCYILLNMGSDSSAASPTAVADTPIPLPTSDPGASSSGASSHVPAPVATSDRAQDLQEIPPPSAPGPSGLQPHSGLAKPVNLASRPVWFVGLLNQQAISLTVPEVVNKTGVARVGAILDHTSRPGKEAKIAIELAMQEFNIKNNQSAVLYLQNSRNKPVHAAFAAKQLIDEHKVKDILGGQTWEEASAIAEVISNIEHEIPIFLSLAGTSQQKETEQWPFFIQAVPTQTTQMNAIAAILQSLGIRQVTLIYETSKSSSIISHFSQALRKKDLELTHILPLTSSYSLEKELEVLKKQRRKVFVIHTSVELGVRLFKAAKKMEMIGEGYLWVATNEITDLFHSINSTMISSLKGIIGVKSYFNENTKDFKDFRKRFRLKFRLDYPKEDEQDEPGIFAVQGYNVMKSLETNSHKWEPINETIVEIVYVIGKGYHSVYWTEGLGFSETVDDVTNGATNYARSRDNVGLFIWPVQPWYAQRRRRNLVESSEDRMKVGVPGRSLFEQFVSVKTNEKNETVIDGFSIRVFDEMMRKMNLQYDLVPFNDSYDKLVESIKTETFDAVAGDVTIISKRHDLADFTQPYTESGLEMIVPVRSRLSNEAWLFMKPFNATMWWLIGAITVYNGFIIWLIERNHNEDLRGSVITQIGIIIWLGFTTLFTLRGDKLHSNLSRMAIIMWLFVALIITQSYTASLASMLTAQRLEPTITSVESLRNMNATVGYCNGSFVNEYLVDVLGFTNITVKSYNSTHKYAEGLNSGEIAAIFLEVPSAKVFLAQYCKSFVRTGETFKVGGFGFAFPRGFTRLSDANKALMNVSESGKLKELEDRYIISEKCVDEESSPDEEDSLSPHSFWILFVLTGGTSTVALGIYMVTSIRDIRRSNIQEQTNMSKLILAYIKDWKRKLRRSSSMVVNVESARHTRNIDQLTQDERNDL